MNYNNKTKFYNSIVKCSMTPWVNQLVQFSSTVLNFLFILSLACTLREHNIVWHLSWFSTDILEGELDAELDTEWLLLADDPRPLLFPLPFSILSGVTEIKKKNGNQGLRQDFEKWKTVHCFKNLFNFSTEYIIYFDIIISHY